MATGRKVIPAIGIRRDQAGSGNQHQRLMVAVGEQAWTLDPQRYGPDCIYGGATAWMHGMPSSDPAMAVDTRTERIGVRVATGQLVVVR